jgi:ATP-dependent Lhr-like helicase
LTQEATGPIRVTRGPKVKLSIPAILVTPVTHMNRPATGPGERGHVALSSAPVSRVRRPEDWRHDVEAARSVERAVAHALSEHQAVSHLADYTAEMDELDFEFRLDGGRVRLDVKEKRQPLSSEFVHLWPDVPSTELLVLDETCFRALMWAEGLGYLLVRDVPAGKWHVFGPWELCLGPRRRFERRGDRGAGEFLKGKLLVDMRTAAATSAELSVDRVVDVVRASRRALRQVRAVPIQGRGSPPVVPRLVEPEDQTRTPPRMVRADEAVDVDPRWAGLDPALVASIKSRWGWDEPTTVQFRAFPSVLRGVNTLILAPTAGGKTEAAILPLLDVHHQGGWQAPSILMISPLKALLDDQLVRYRKAAALTGATVFAWHGDVGRDERNAFRNHPADILLTTPESLEQLLSRPGTDSRLLSRVRAVVVDEVHVFAGTARGAQLASMLERIDQRSNTDIQRLGLSATVGNPASVLQWLHGGSQRQSEVVQAGQPMKGEELAIASYEAVTEAATLIGEAVAGRRALVFAPSRRRAEQLANALGVSVHHSSIAATGRTEAIGRLTEGTTGCIVATSSLEMGIDIGDIEIVVNDGAPSDPGSYLQRLGRAGRRDGNRRMLLTVGDPDSLLLALSVVARARRGDLDPLPPARGARLVLGQQVLALAFEHTALLHSDIKEYLRWSPLFGPLETDIEATTAHLVASGWLAPVGDHLVIGPLGQNRFGGRSFTDLLATFQGTTGAAVIGPDGVRVGTLDWSQVTDSTGEARPEAIVLAGKPWTVVSVDRSAGTVTVIPASRGRAPSWRGPFLEVGRATWEAAREILVATDVPVTADERVLRWLEELRHTWGPRLADPVREDTGWTVVDAFAGAHVHRGLLAAVGADGSADGPTCRIKLPLQATAIAARRALDRWEQVVDAEAARQATKLAVRHPDLVAPSVLLAEAREFHVDTDGLRAALSLIADRP